MDAEEKSFEFAQDIIKQLLALATGIPAFMITFSKDFAQNITGCSKLLALWSWGFFIASVLFGLLALMSLTGVLASVNEKFSGKPKSKTKGGGIYSANIRIFTVLQMLAFFVGLVLVGFFGWSGITSTAKVDSGVNSGVAHAVAGDTPPAQREVEYFDPHNHLSGILPYQAYANLPAYIAMEEGNGPGVTEADKEALYTYLKETWSMPQKAQSSDSIYTPGTRIGLGSRATLELYPVLGTDEAETLDGALERVLTATPFTEFDAAYAFRGDINKGYLSRYYSSDPARLPVDLCKATVLELARTHIIQSEQSMSFIGGWGPDGTKSPRLADIRCYSSEPEKLRPQLTKLGEPVPSIRILLMTHTAELAESADGGSYSTFVPTRRCLDTPWSDKFKRPRTTPQTVENALLGQEESGKPVVTEDQRQGFFDTVIGIDTAAPELTCFTKAGMTHYVELVEAVYQAAKIRRERFGWQGKLLVHTHVGEGFSVYYGKDPPSRPWKQSDVFGALPDVSRNETTNPQAAHDNIDMLLAAIATVEQKHSDIHRYVVFRLGHVTWADQAQAELMAKEEIEADVNLDSNIATGAYPFSRMPKTGVLKVRLDKALLDPVTNLEINDFPHFVLPHPDDVDAVGSVLGESSLKYLLVAHVRVLLGSDGAGVEHSDMPREYAIAASLIKYWSGHDADFRVRAGDISEQDYFDNVAWHLNNMATNDYLPYR